MPRWRRSASRTISRSDRRLHSMALPFLSAIGDDTVNTATFLVSLQDFSEVGDTSVFIDEPQVTYIEGQMMERGYLDSNLVKPNKIVLKGVPIDLGKIRQDIYAVGTEQDHIIPWKSAWRISQLASGPVRFVLGASGHIAGVISPPSKGRGYWTNEPAVKHADQWFESAERHKGSWWADWLEWLNPRSGEQVAPPAMGSNRYRPLTPAPGTYVLEK